MNPSNDDRDPLDDAYRHASAAEAGRPAASTRGAILAQAAAGARQRAPVANDSRYLWRGVAGVAVLGIAVLLWQQVGHRMPGDQQVVATAPAQRENAAAQSAPVASAPGTPVSQRAEPFTDSPVADTANEVTKPREEERVPTPAPAASRSLAQSSPPHAPSLSGGAAKMSAVQDAARTDPIGLLRLHFPAQYQSDAAHSLWLVQDAVGVVLRTGELPQGSTFGDVRPGIERDLGGRLLRPWRIHTLRNARDQVIELAIAQTP